MNVDALRAQLAGLEAKDQLEKRLAPVVGGMPWAAIASVMQGPAIAGAAIQMVRMGMAATASKASPPAEDFAWFVLLALVGIALRYGSPLLRTAAERRRLRLRRHGVLCAAATVQVNDAFFDERNDRWLPGTVLVSFDPRALHDPDLLVIAARELFLLRDDDRRAMPPERGAIAWDLYHSMGPIRSRTVPPELCSGLGDCRIASVMFPPQPLKSGPLLLALAVRGELAPEGTALLPQDLG